MYGYFVVHRYQLVSPIYLLNLTFPWVYCCRLSVPSSTLPTSCSYGGKSTTRIRWIYRCFLVSNIFYLLQFRVQAIVRILFTCSIRMIVCYRFCRSIQHDPTVAVVLLSALQRLGEIRVAQSGSADLFGPEWPDRNRTV